jgi:ribosomal-protein-alanine N-acetyltransferase
MATVKRSHSLQIRDLTTQDVPELAGLEAATNLCFWGVEHYNRFLEQPEYFGRKALMPDAVAGVKMVGFFLARSILENLELLKIGVYPQHQNCGIGTRLLVAAFAEGMSRGCLRCFLEVRKSNREAIQFYLNHRFSIAGERANYYTEPIEDAWIMERWL